MEFLQEKEVFKEFIYRINTLGRRAPRDRAGCQPWVPVPECALRLFVPWKVWARPLADRRSECTHTHPENFHACLRERSIPGFRVSACLKSGRCLVVGDGS